MRMQQFSGIMYFLVLVYIQGGYVLIGSIVKDLGYIQLKDLLKNFKAILYMIKQLMAYEDHCIVLSCFLPVPVDNLC